MIESLGGVIGDIPAKWLRHGSSPECIRCYAETLSIKNGWSPALWTEENEAINIRLRPERFREISKIPLLKSSKPSECSRVFSCSMADLWHAAVPDQFIHDYFSWLLRYPHISMLLTKRIDRAADWPGPWPEHMWLGTTSGHPITKWRIEYLRRSRAKVRFLSMGPLLASMLPLDLTGIHQVIVEGESGRGFRPMQMEWVLEIRDECARQGVAFFFKQQAAHNPGQRPWIVEPDGTRKQYLQFPGELTEPTIVPSHVQSLDIAE